MRQHFLASLPGTFYSRRFNDNHPSHFLSFHLARQRQHFLALLPGIEFFCPLRFSDIHLLIFHHSFILLISHLSWQIQHFLASFGSFHHLIFHHINNFSSVHFLFGWRLHFFYFSQTRSLLHINFIVAFWILELDSLFKWRLHIS